MTTLRDHVFLAIKLGLLATVVSALQFGCGGEEEGAVDDEPEMCSDYQTGSLSAGEVLRDEHGFDALDYEFLPKEGEVIFEARDEDTGDTGKFVVNGRGIDEPSPTELAIAMDYESRTGEHVKSSSTMTTLNQMGHIAHHVGGADIVIHNELQVGQLTLASRTLASIDESRVAHLEEGEQILDVEDSRLIADDGTASPDETLQLVESSEELVDEDDLVDWFEHQLDDLSPESERAMEEFAAVMGDENLVGHFQDIYESCGDPSGRDADLAQHHRELIEGNTCEEFGLGLVLGAVGIGSLFWLAFNVGELSHSLASGEFDTVDAGSLAATLIVGGAGLYTLFFTSFAAAGIVAVMAVTALVIVLIGILILSVGAALESSSRSRSATDGSCGNPLFISRNGTSFPFRRRGEFDWYTRGDPDRFAIQIRQSSNPASTCHASTRIEAIGVDAGGDRLVISAGRPAPLAIAGQSTDPNNYFWRLGDDIQIHRDPVTPRAYETYHVEHPAGERLRVDVFDDRLDIELDAPDELRETAGGIVGAQYRAGQNPGLVLRDGTIVEEPVTRRELHRQFGDSWQVDPDDSMFDARKPELTGHSAADGELPPPRRIDDLTDEQLEYAERICRQKGRIADPTLLRHCLLDVGCTGDPSYLTTYARATPPVHPLEIVDEDGEPVAPPVEVADIDEPADGVDSIAQYLGDDQVADSCPADNENSAESVGSRQIRTVDGYGYEFRSAGEFVLVESRTSDGLMVQVRQEPADEEANCPDARRNTAVAARMGDDTIAFYAVDDDDGRIRLNDQRVDLAGGFEILSGGHTAMRVDQDHYFLEWSDGTWLDVRFDGDRLNIRFNAYFERMGQLQGIFGQFNGYPHNDIALRDGTELDTWDDERIHGQFADSWRIDQGESLFEYGDDESTADFTDPSVPQSALTMADVPADEHDDALETCEDAGVEAGSVMTDCIIDVYCTGDPSVAEEHEDRAEPVEDQIRREEKELVEMVPESGDLCCHVDCEGGPDADCDFVCGDGAQSASHDWCEGDCPETDDDCADDDPSDTCTWGGVETYHPQLHPEDAAYVCANRCEEQVQTQCIDGNDCCPPGGQCTSITDNDCDIDPTVGAGCTDDADCADIGGDVDDPDDVLCLREESHRIFGGTCTAVCNDDSECPDGSHCAVGPLHSGGMIDIQLVDGTVQNVCVPSCDDDADCPRDGFGCYDANDDGRSECWHRGTEESDFGDPCSVSRDCGEIGDGAMCVVHDLNLVNNDIWGTGATMCTRRCDLPNVTCPDDWGCDTNSGVCIKPADAEQVATACDDDTDCDAGRHDPYRSDRCYDEDDPPQLEGGYCSFSCGSDADCPDGTKCPDPDLLYDDIGRSFGSFSGGTQMQSICVPECDTDADCPRDGYGCFDATLDGETECWHIGEEDGDFGDDCLHSSACGEIGEHAVCRLYADDDGDEQRECSSFCGTPGLDCPSDRTCISQGMFGGVETCGDDVGPGDADIGGPCEADDDCGGVEEEDGLTRECIDESSSAMDDGYCLLTGCDVFNPNCPAGSHCSAGGELRDGQGNLVSSACVKSCDSDDDCSRDGYRCYDATGDGETECWHYGDGTGDYGDACDASADCQFGEDAVCRPEAGGLCSTRCADDRDSCPDGYGCGSSSDRCIETCDDADDCPGDFVDCFADTIEHEDGTLEDGCGS